MTWENSAITIATLLPLAGALVIALVPRRYEMGVRALGIVFTGAALVLAIAITFTFDYARRASSSSSTPAGSPPSTPGTTWGSTASASPCTC